MIPVLTERGLAFTDHMFGDDLKMLESPGGRQGLLAKYNLQ